MEHLDFGNGLVTRANDAQDPDFPAFWVLPVDGNVVVAADDPLIADRPIDNGVFGDEVPETCPVPGLRSCPQLPDYLTCIHIHRLPPGTDIGLALGLA